MSRAWKVRMDGGGFNRARRVQAQLTSPPLYPGVMKRISSTMKQSEDMHYCRRCRGFCPSGTLDGRLCLDCRKIESPDEVRKREFALALAARSSSWFRIVWTESLL